MQIPELVGSLHRLLGNTLTEPGDVLSFIGHHICELRNHSAILFYSTLPLCPDPMQPWPPSSVITSPFPPQLWPGSGAHREPE